MNRQKIFQWFMGIAAIGLITAGVAVANGPYGAYVGSIPTYPNQTANSFLASPDGANGSPVMRAIVNGDLAGVPSLTGLTGTTIPTSSASTIATGSTNAGGKVTGAASGSPTTIIVVFGNSGWPNYAWCTIAPLSAAAAGAAPYISAQAKTGFTITYTTINSAPFQYTCMGS